MAKGTFICVAVFTAVGVAILATGISLIYVFQNLVESRIKQSVPLVNGSESFKAWQSPPVPVYMQFWVWDLLNADEVGKEGARPVMKQRGPYTYREIRNKEHIKFQSDGTLSYIEPKEYEFVRGMSVGPEDDRFTTVNLVILTAAHKLKPYVGNNTWTRFFAKILQSEGEELYKNYSVHQYLWGFKDPIIEEINQHLPSFIKPIQNSFGLFAKPNGNGSNDGEYQIYTGEEDLNKLNVIDRWKGMRNLQWWNTSYCNMINGTDGTLWHPFIKKTDVLEFFSSDICRSLTAVYQHDRSVDGIRLYRFSPPDSAFADPHKNHDNLGFCTTKCFKAGVLDLSGCKGAPIMASLPNFYQADQEYIDAIDGVHPDKEEHETFIDVEPNTGSALSAAKKLQINAYIERNVLIEETKELQKPLIFPLIWLNETSTIDKASANKFKGKVLNPMTMLTIIQFIVIGVGGLVTLICLIILSLMLIRYHRRSTGGGSPLSVNDSDHRGLLQGSTEE